MKRRSRKEHVRRAAERYESGWAKPHEELTPDELAFRIKYAFMQGADYERRTNFRQERRRKK